MQSEDNKQASTNLLKKVDILIFKFVITLGDTVLDGGSLTKLQLITLILQVLFCFYVLSGEVISATSCYTE